MINVSIVILAFAFTLIAAQNITCYNNPNGPENGNEALITQENCTFCGLQQQLEGTKVILTNRTCCETCAVYSVPDQGRRVCCTVPLCNYNYSTALDGQLGERYLQTESWSVRLQHILTAYFTSSNKLRVIYESSVGVGMQNRLMNRNLLNTDYSPALKHNSEHHILYLPYSTIQSIQRQ
ncbi:hypothetical protein CRM22_004195 [Opisthorchis felineus]|uniref:Uncharacterized protein n=1 Tax=Opisthorchis felineus TaxID=147828 RepID=A0A4S2LXH6_OPIFE|nr:hypothetical protein CRM22_004195 [Opisthorchis felineus]